MSSTRELLLGTIVPVIGGLVAIVMYATPLKATHAARKKQQLGDLNPVPFAVTFASTACWCAYGFAAPDYHMFLPNIPGFAAAIFTTVSCFALASIQVQNTLLSIMCGSSAVILLLGVMARFVLQAQQGRLMWGIVCNIITVIYYSAPVSSAVKVIRTRSSASIYRPTCIANLVNATLWVAYGIAVVDPFIWIPNGLGGLMSIFLLALTIIYPAASPLSSTGLDTPLNKNEHSAAVDSECSPSAVVVLVDAGSASSHKAEEGRLLAGHSNVHMHTPGAERFDCSPEQEGASVGHDSGCSSIARAGDVNLSKASSQSLLHK